MTPPSRPAANVVQVSPGHSPPEGPRDLPRVGPIEAGGGERERGRAPSRGSVTLPASRAAAEENSLFHMERVLASKVVITED